MAEILDPNEIRPARERLGLSRSELSRLSGVSRPQIYRIERGLCSPRHSSLRRLSDALASEAIRHTRHKLTREEPPPHGTTLLEEGVPGAGSILGLIDADLPVLASVMVRVTSKYSGHSLVMSAIEALAVSKGFEDEFTFEIAKPNTFAAEERYESPHPRALKAKLEQWRREKPD